MNQAEILPASRYLKVLLALMLVSVMFPIFSGYLAGGLLLVWILFEQIKGRVVILEYLRGELPQRGVDRVLAKNLIGPMMLGMFFLCAAIALAAFVAYFSSPYSAPAGKTLKVVLHQLVKISLLGSVSLIALLESVRRGAGTKYLAKALAICMVVNFIYCLVQRYTGIDLTHGLTARLGEHRYAYDVYRVSGFMGHPLTLTYNLMIVALGSVALAVFKWRDQKGNVESKLWFLAGLAALATITISGSRFVLIVLVFVPLICEMRRIVKYWPYALGAGALIALGLWAEGSLLGRFAEFFNENQSIYERFPRFLFWKIHWQMFLDHPVAGVSLSGLSKATEAYYHASGIHDKMYTAHNVFLQFMADSGLIGLIGLLVFLAGYFKSSIKSFAAHGQSTGLSYLFVATVLVAIQQNNLRDSEFLLAFWFFSALQLTFLLTTGSAFDGDRRKSIENFQPSTGGENSPPNLPGQSAGDGPNNR